MTRSQEERPHKRSDEEVERESILSQPQLHETGVEDLMNLYEKIENVYANAYYDPPQPLALYSASANR